MELQDTYALLEDLLMSNVFKLIAALIVFVLGWVLALLISSFIRVTLHKFKISQRLSDIAFGKDNDHSGKIETWIGRLAYFVVLLTILIMGVQVLDIQVINQPLDALIDSLMAFTPRIGTPILLLLVAWLVASALKFFIVSVGTKTRLEERLGSKYLKDKVSKKDKTAITRAFGDTVFWLVFLVFLPEILSSLALNALIAPIGNMVDSLLGYLPHLFGAVVIFAIGWFVAKIVRRILVNLLASVGVDNVGDKAGIKSLLGEQKLSEVVGTLGYILILIPVLISTLNALRLEAVTAPASEMLNQILQSFPALFGAGLVLFIAFIIGRVVADLAKNFLTGIGFNSVLSRVGFSSHQSPEDHKTPAEIVGSLTLIAIMLFASIEAFNMLGFEALAGIVGQFTIFAGQVLLGLLIFAVGLYVAKVAAEGMTKSSLAHSSILAAVSRVAIIAFASAMALRQMGIAGEIVSITFGIVLAGIAIAFGLAFGLGGKATAEKYLTEMLNYIKSKK